MIIDELMDSTSDKLKEREGVGVGIGMSYRGVLLSDGGLGIAHSFRRETTGYCEFVDKVGRLERGLGTGQTC